MKVLVVVVSTFLLCQCLAGPVIQMKQNKKNRFHYKDIVKLYQEVPSHTANVGLDLCPTCVQFMDQAINILLNYILQIGVVGSCAQICTALTNKTGSEALGVVCNVLCDYVGLQEFVKLVEKADLDSIYFCELTTICPVFDNGDAKVTNLTVTPKQGPQGTFLVDLIYVSKNGTGTGEIILEIATVDGIPVEGGWMMKRQNAGTYGMKISVKARPDPDCDPTQQPCEEWLPGAYTIKTLVCNGECGSKHPHSQIYDQATTQFTITQ